MKKIIIIFCLGVGMALASPVFGQDKFTVSGTVEYSGKSDIYICLLDMDAFKILRKELPKPPFTLMKHCDQDGKASFAFDQVPKGDFLIIAFLDQNGNGKLDVDTWGFYQEPLVWYKSIQTLGGHSNWNDQKFTVDKDVTEIALKF